MLNVYLGVICSLKRLKELRAKEPCNKGKMLKLYVEAGGCSGFQYTFLLDGRENADDRLVGYMLFSLSFTFLLLLLLLRILEI
jgi:Fe-S cluster assembly iron-binding protein IscA